MLKIKVTIAMLLLTVFAINAVPNQAFAEECGSWTTSSSYNYTCDTTDGCGVLWLQDTAKHTESQYRLCTTVSGDNVVTIRRETRTVTVKDGCC